jgi:hypothetical protein
MDEETAAELKRHVRRARQIIREDKIIAALPKADSGDDVAGDAGDPADPAKPPKPPRKPPADPVPPKRSAWWGDVA